MAVFEGLISFLPEEVISQEVNSLKCLIDGKLQECKVVENLGYVHDVGAYAKVVEYQGKEYVIVKRGAWRNRTVEEWLGRTGDGFAVK